MGNLFGPKTETVVPWKPYSHGRIVINVDASVGNGLFAQNYTKKLLLFASKWGTGSSPLLAKCKALM